MNTVAMEPTGVYWIPLFQRLSAFPTGKQVASWLGVAPGTKIIGGKKLSGRTLPSANRAGHALGLAASALRTSQSALGADYRRLCAWTNRRP